MYTTCLFCNRALGANDVVETFPVGRCLAFDAARGRLGVICGACGRWNLTPLDERWEAIETCERLFRATRLRRSTPEIGLACASDGLELVRIGRPLRPEMAAWRYAARFAARRATGVGRLGLTIGGVALGGLTGGLLTAGALHLYQVAGAFAGVALTCEGAAVMLWRRARTRVVARVPIGDGRVGRVTQRLARQARLRWWNEDEWRLDVPVALGPGTTPRELSATGDVARTLARAVLPALNGYGARAAIVDDAVSLLEDSGSPDRIFRRALRHDVQAEAARVSALHNVPYRDGALAALPTAMRLALEMATHEELEQRALDGELADLERAWRDAEEIAAIADRLDFA